MKFFICSCPASLTTIINFALKKNIRFCTHSQTHPHTHSHTHTQILFTYWTKGGILNARLPLPRYGNETLTKSPYIVSLRETELCHSVREKMIIIAEIAYTTHNNIARTHAQTHTKAHIQVHIHTLISPRFPTAEFGPVSWEGRRRGHKSSLRCERKIVSVIWKWLMSYFGGEFERELRVPPFFAFASIIVCAANGRWIDSQQTHIHTHTHTHTYPFTHKYTHTVRDKVVQN